MPKRRRWEEDEEPGAEEFTSMQDHEAERMVSEAAAPPAPSVPAPAPVSDVGPDSVRVEYVDQVRDGRPVRAVVGRRLAESLGKRVRILPPGA